jgi:hypothetical protein
MFRRSGKSCSKAKKKKGTAAPWQNGVEPRKVDGGGPGSNSRQVAPDTTGMGNIDDGKRFVFSLCCTSCVCSICVNPRVVLCSCIIEIVSISNDFWVVFLPCKVCSVTADGEKEKITLIF